MKISNLAPLKYNYSNYNKKPNIPHQIKPKTQAENTFGLSGEYYRSLFDIKPKNLLSFGNLYHKTISSKIPVYSPCCNYDDVDEF